VDHELESWFVSAILPHQAALTRYLNRLCKSSSEVPDLRQETYFRVYESAKKSRPRFPRTFLFTTARNLVIDKFRRERVVSIHYTQDALFLDRSVDELTPERSLAARQDLQQLTSAFHSLPEKTRSVIWLRRVSGLSQREAAESLGIDEGALEGHMIRGMRGLAKAVG
jgi:RNA polymerase sigma factor (sigma-70 family)